MIFFGILYEYIFYIVRKSFQAEIRKVLEKIFINFLKTLGKLVNFKTILLENFI